MNSVLVDLKRYREEIITRRRNFDYSLGGKTGFCFIEGKYIVKIYNNPQRKSQYTDLSIYTSDRISFPIEYICKKGYIIGEIMPYFNVDTIDNTLNIRTNIDVLCDAYREIKEEIAKYPSIIMLDLWSKNVLYSSKKGMYLIDVTDWRIVNGDFTNRNIQLLNDALGQLMRRMIFEEEKAFVDMDKSYRILHDNNLGNELLNIINAYFQYDYHFIELFEVYKEFIRIKYNYDIKTISDMKKYTKIMKFS